MEKAEKRKCVRRQFSPFSDGIVDKFRRHLESGNSPRSFVAKLQGHEQAYSFLKATNREFYELAESHTPPMHRRGHLNYSPKGINNQATLVKRARYKNGGW